MSQHDLEYLRHRRDVMMDAYDKVLLSLSGGALTLSIVLVDRIAGESPKLVGALLTAWVLLALSVVALLVTYVLVSASLESAFAAIKEAKDPGTADALRAGKWARRLSFGSGAAFVVALGLLGWFALANIA